MSLEKQMVAAALYVLLQDGEVEVPIELLDKELTVMRRFGTGNKDTFTLFVLPGKHGVDCHLHDSKDVCERCDMNG